MWDKSEPTWYHSMKKYGRGQCSESLGHPWDLNMTPVEITGHGNILYLEYVCLMGYITKSMMEMSVMWVNNLHMRI